VSTFPSPVELRQQIKADLKDDVVAFRQKVQIAMRRQGAASGMPNKYFQITIDTSNVKQIVRETIASELKSSGWAVEHICDQRDGNFLKLTIPTD